jgi:hypothetical protein
MRMVFYILFLGIMMTFIVTKEVKKDDPYLETWNMVIMDKAKKSETKNSYVAVFFKDKSMAKGTDAAPKLAFG